MNKKLTTIWGVGLVVVLMVSLLVGAIPASAKNLDFTPETLPGSTNNILANVDIYDMAVAGDGQTIYAVVDSATGTVYKSTDGGAGWSTVTASVSSTALQCDLVAVAPDDAGIVAVADASTYTLYVTTNGGTTWGSLSTAGDAAIADIAVSTDYSGNHYVAVAATDGDVLIYKLGIGGAWSDISANSGFSDNTAIDNVLAVEFSPNFSSDQVLCVLTEDAGTNVKLEMYSVNLETWNSTAGFDNFPVTLKDSSGGDLAGTMVSGSLALAPTYLGGDEVERVVFVGINDNASSGDEGVYRLEDYTVKHIKTGVTIWSLAYDGNVLVAGTTDVRIWRSNDALASSPTFYVSTESKSPGGATNPALSYAGANVVAGTRGNESAFSVSTDSGMSFNDISLIDTKLVDISDAAVAADGSVKYFASTSTGYGSGATSIWRKAGMGAWQRILNFADTQYIIRLAPEDGNVIYVGKPTAKTLYFSKDGGTTRWYSRTSRYNITDLGVESEDVAYVAYGDSISKTVNSGFTWGTAKGTELMGGSVATITVLSEDSLLVGGTTGYVSYSTDGNSSWTRIEQNVTSPGTSAIVHLAADGLTPGSYIYACNRGNDIVTRWGVGQPQTVPWFNLETPDNGSTYLGYGIALKGGVLYVNTANSASSRVLRTMEPSIAVASTSYWSYWDQATSSFATKGSYQPSNLQVANGGFKGMPGYTIYAVDNLGPGGGPTAGYDFWKSCIDTLATVGPVQTSPADGREVKLNPISGSVSNVALTWSRVSEATKYEYQVAYDADFVEQVATYTAVTNSKDSVSAVIAGTSLNLGSTYYWRVRAAQDGPVYSPWSETRSYSVESGGTVSPGILAPENGGYVAQTSPSFSWAPVSGATRYEFQLSADTSFAAPLASTQHAAAGASPDVTLEVGTTYYWRVRSIEPSMGEWSTIANFTVSETVPGEGGTGDVTVNVPEIVIPEIVIPPAEVTIPPAADTTPAISEGLLWAVIIIGAVLVIALIVLIVRTRRTV